MSRENDSVLKSPAVRGGNVGVQRLYVLVLGVMALSAATPDLRAQCVAEGFESFAVGTSITTQVDEVTFSVGGQSCGGSPFINLRVADQYLGNDFSSRVLLIDGGCPDFSTDFLKMVFGEYQKEVRFGLGPWSGDYNVRVYSTTTGGSPVLSQTIKVPGSGFVGAHYQVVVERAQRDIRRIEVEAALSGLEAIDDLRFGADDTPPTIQIDSPLPLECVSGETVLTGTTCDDDGAYDRDRLEYRRSWPAPEVDWTLVREFVGSPVCSSDSLYEWDTAEPGVDGLYSLRVSAQNACAMSATEVLPVVVDNQVDHLELRSPANRDIVGGAVCFDGTASDLACFDRYEVAYRPTTGGIWSPVDAANAFYSTPVVDDPLAFWRASQGLPDGDYFVALAVYTATGASASEQISVTLDNTAPTAVLTDPEPGSTVSGVVTVSGTATDDNIDYWELTYHDPVTGTWVYVSDDSDSVDGVLGEWDVSTLADGIYTLRLEVVDRALVGCGVTAIPHVSEAFLTVEISGDVVFSDGFESGPTTAQSNGQNGR